MTLKVLLIEDDKLDQNAFTRLVERSDLPYDYKIAATVGEARALLQTQPFDVTLVDYDLSDGTGLDVLDAVPAKVAVILITGVGSEETAIAALRAGANDYLVKDQNRGYLKFLPLTIERAIEQKRKEQQLLTLAQAVMSSSDSIYVTDLADRITHVNRAFCDTYGYEPEEIIGHSCRSLLARNSEPTRLAGTAELESFHQRQDGGRFPISMTRSPVRDDRGVPIAYVSVVRDFTERHRARMALQESEERYRSLVTSMADGVILQDRAGAILACNSSAERILGRDRQQLMRLSRTDSVWHALREDESREHDPATTTLQTGEAQHQVVMPINRPDDGLVWIAVNTESLRHSAGEEPYGVVSSFTDITPLKETIAERDRLIEHLDAFAHTVAHDLKNPAALILTYADLLMDMHETLAASEIRQSLGSIKKAAQDAVEIIEALLLLAGASGLDDMQATVVDMAAAVANAQARLQHLIDQHQAIVRITADLPSARGFAPWVETIVVNYMSNALKYGGKPPLIEIGAERRSDGMVRYWIRDNGDGLTPEEQAQLFRPFTRLSHAVDGHGLGLSVVRQITERLGGTVGVTSKIGRGSEFFFTLPASADRLPQWPGAPKARPSETFHSSSEEYNSRIDSI